MLPGQMNEKRSLNETGHRIYSAAYDPTGKFIATIGEDNNILLWDSESGIIHRTLAGLTKRPNRVVFSGSGKLLYSAGEGGTITTWDLALVKIVNSTKAHSGAIKTLAISPDGSILASGGEDKVIRVWSAEGEKLNLLYELSGHRKTINSLDFSPDGKILVSGGADQLLMEWDMKNGINTRQAKPNDGWIRCVRFSPDGRYIASGGDDKLIQIMRSDDLTVVHTLKGHTDWVQTLAYSPSGEYLFSGGHDQYIRVWETSTGKLVYTSPKLEQIVLSVDASPVKDDLISSCLLSEQLRIWAHAYGEAAPKLAATHEDLPPAQQISENKPENEDNSDHPLITVFSPEPVNGQVVHDKATILIVGQAKDPEGIQSMLVNRQRVELSGSGIFQTEIELNSGENQVDLVAVSNRGKLARYGFVILCTDETATADQAVSPQTTGGSYHALIIGVNDYIDDDIPDLDYPIADAEALYSTLISDYSFDESNMVLMKNPNRTDIIIAMDELSRKITDQDNLLIFYAGHGYWDEKTGIGYWLPADAARNNTANWFRNSTLRDFIGSIQSKHTLLIADACFSGSIFKTRSAFFGDDRGIHKLHELPSRKAMTSGALKEEVPDKSVFVKYLIRELKNNQEKYLPSEELFSNFKSAVLNNSPNVPQYGTIQNVGDEGGDFIFIRK